MNFRAIATGLGLFISLFPGTAPAQTAVDSEACISASREELGWHPTTESPQGRAIIEAVCNGAQSLAPAQCLSRVVHAGTYLDDPSEWTWDSARILCSGATNDTAAIGCFRTALQEDQPWSAALRTCAAAGGEMIAGADGPATVPGITQPGGGDAPSGQGVAGGTDPAAGSVSVPTGMVVDYAALPIGSGQEIVAGTRFEAPEEGLALLFDAASGLLMMVDASGNPLWRHTDDGGSVAPGGRAMVTETGELLITDADGQTVFAPLGDKAVPGSILYINMGALQVLSPHWMVLWQNGDGTAQLAAADEAPASAPAPAPAPTPAPAPAAGSGATAPSQPPASGGGTDQTQVQTTDSGSQEGVGDQDPTPRGGSFVDTFWGGTEPSTQPSPLGNYDYQIRADGVMRVNPPYEFLDQIEGNDGFIVGLELGPDGNVFILDEQGEMIGRLAIDPPRPGSTINITSDGMLVIAGPGGEELWSASNGIDFGDNGQGGTSGQPGGTEPSQPQATMEPNQPQGGTSPDQSQGGGMTDRADTGTGEGSDAGPADLGEVFVPATLTTMWRQNEGECLSANREGEMLDGAVHMDACAPRMGGNQVWLIYPVSEDEATARLVNTNGDEPLCLTANLGGAESTHRGGLYVDTCIDAAEQVWKLEALPDTPPYFRLKSTAIGDEICAEGNRLAPDAQLEGAAFMDSCQNVSGQLWIVGSVPQ